jgi:hypothetical protein
MNDMNVILREECFTRSHGVTSEKIVLFVVTAMRTSNATVVTQFYVESIRVCGDCPSDSKSGNIIGPVRMNFNHTNRLFIFL